MNMVLLKLNQRYRPIDRLVLLFEKGRVTVTLDILAAGFTMSPGISVYWISCGNICIARRGVLYCAYCSVLRAPVVTPNGDGPRDRAISAISASLCTTIILSLLDRSWRRDHEGERPDDY